MKKLTRENAKEIECAFGAKLDDCVAMLIENREKGQSVFVDFFGYRLYSCDVTLESAYLEVFGETKEEYDKKEKECGKKKENLLESINDAKDIRVNILGAMGLCQTWLTLENLKSVIPPEKWMKVERELIETLPQTYQVFLDDPNLSREKVQQVIEQKLKGPCFQIGMNSEGQFIIEYNDLVETASRGGQSEELAQIDISEINTTDFLLIAKDAMKAHLDFERFYDNDYSSPEQIEQLLKRHIEIAEIALLEIDKTKLDSVREQIDSMLKELKEIAAKGVKGIE